MANTTTLVTPSVAPTQQPQSPFETRLNAALEHARRLTEMNGTNSIDVALAWEMVEELRAVVRMQEPASPKSAFALYCEANPDAPECRIYDL